MTWQILDNQRIVFRQFLLLLGAKQDYLAVLYIYIYIYDA